MQLIDTSAWVEYLRRTGSPANAEVRRLLREEPGAIATTEPVIMELLAGATSEPAFAKLQVLTGGLRLLPVDAALDYRDAAVVYRAVRAAGGTVRKILDCLIAVVAARTGATLVHRDRDFDALAPALPDLRVRSLV
ncbi:type II toxin-antitoxin system VapC family toxin [Pseudonocardia asaccharolytica]|uniref:type II toxin-antitoxin system VapC family toxin n=1 Tax=Pseudonocardia asaccharolytica TaxID=54010 RepID=UPI00040166E1|nr:PIN domain nuclease [Pseudonocardia asaccharolytica]